MGKHCNMKYITALISLKIMYAHKIVWTMEIFCILMYLCTFWNQSEDVCKNYKIVTADIYLGKMRY